MRYKLEVYNIWELGKRANQEDSLFPEYNQQTIDDRLFILCDGMGGHASGEVASSTVCRAMSTSIANMCPDPEGAFTDEILQQAICDAFDALDSIAPDDGSPKKMGTTMTFLKLHANGATIAHMGDSRVYHVRPGQTADDTQILFVTEDHSLVNDLVKIGELTPEEARTSRQKNVITRAMQPHMERRPRADIYHTVDIQPGDYFFMCSDGILERWEDYHVRHCFSYAYGDDYTRVQNIINETSDNSDNHTAIIVKILDVEGTAQLLVDDRGQNNMYGQQLNNESTMIPDYDQTVSRGVGQIVDSGPQFMQYDNTMRTGGPGAMNAAPMGTKPESITWFWLMLLTIVALLAVFLFLLLR
ncbi:MAG: serine/threonine-protein phosphatase [Prevotella sp.]|nr:serine/threonine-protein phosphatase [Prevotella sp.]